MEFKFSPTSTIVHYFPQLLKREWWPGFQDPQTGNVTLMDIVGTPEELPTALKGCVIAASDVLETKGGGY